MATVRTTRRHGAREVPPSNGATDRSCIRIPTSAMALEGFRAWALSPEFPQHGRISFLEGEIYLDVSSEALETHVAVKAELTRVLATLSRELGDGKFYGDGVLVSNEPAGLSNNPDAVYSNGKASRPDAFASSPGRDERESTANWRAHRTGCWR
jgi:hypothetical protein